MVQAERKVNRKTRSGTVVSAKNDETVIVAVGRATRHRQYGKVIRQTKRYPVHDPENQATLGDLVVIEECRPISKTKHWRLVEVLTEREVAEVSPESIDEALVDEVQRSADRAAAEEESGDAAEAEASATEETPSSAAEAPAVAEASGVGADEPDAAPATEETPSSEVEAAAVAEGAPPVEADEPDAAPEPEPVAEEAAASDASAEAAQPDEERAEP